MYALAPAKINIGLDIISRLDSGFHCIESVFVPIRLSDVVEIVPTHHNSTTLSLSGIDIPGKTEDNLFYKLIALLRQKKWLAEEQHFLAHIHKRIPVGGGLGGGSSDVVAFLSLLRKWNMVSITDEFASELIAELGSDCSFFVDPKISFVEGKGEKITPLQINLKNYFFVLVISPIHISTAWAYSRCTPAVPTQSLFESIQQEPIHWKSSVKNDFEKIVFSDYPALQRVKDTLYEKGAIYASMSGSGSVIYGMFTQESNPSEKVVASLRTSFPSEYVVIPTRLWDQEN